MIVTVSQTTQALIPTRFLPIMASVATIGMQTVAALGGVQPRCGTQAAQTIGAATAGATCQQLVPLL
eukprot:1976423-Amphidinium_carterae.1